MEKTLYSLRNLLIEFHLSKNSNIIVQYQEGSSVSTYQMTNDHQHHHQAVGGVIYVLTLYLNLIFPTSPVYLIDDNQNNDVEEDTLCVAVVVGDRLDGGNLINTSW